MKSIKVFYMGRQLKEVYPHATRWQVIKWKVSEFLKKCARFVFKVSMIGAVGAVVFFAGALYTSHSTLSYASSQTIIQTVKDTNFPILDKIATCESQGSQLDKSGQVLLHPNTDGSVDIGKYEINNRAWGKKASAMGYNLAVEQDNHDFAIYLFENYGSEPWYSSKKCWQKL